jgi:hypothetical protein
MNFFLWNRERASNDGPTTTSQNCPYKLAAPRDVELVNTNITATVSWDNPSEKQLKSMIAILEPDATYRVLVPTVGCRVLGQFTPETDHRQNKEEAQAHM